MSLGEQLLLCISFELALRIELLPQQLGRGSTRLG
jgi:hypothetical protein